MKHLVLQKSRGLIYPVGKRMDLVITYIEEIIATFKRNHINLDKYANVIYIWCRGSSGAILAGMLAYTFKKAPVIINHVKKEGERSHSYNSLESSKGGIDIVIDDFMDTGETIFRIWRDSGIKKIDYLILDEVNPAYFQAALLEQKDLVSSYYNLYLDQISICPSRGLQRPIPEVLITTNLTGFMDSSFDKIGSLDELKPTIKQ